MVSRFRARDCLGPVSSPAVVYINCFIHIQMSGSSGRRQSGEGEVIPASMTAAGSLEMAWRLWLGSGLTDTFFTCVVWTLQCYVTDLVRAVVRESPTAGSRARIRSGCAVHQAPTEVSEENQSISEDRRRTGGGVRGTGWEDWLGGLASRPALGQTAAAKPPEAFRCQRRPIA